jgi:hypothetical protein
VAELVRAGAAYLSDEFAVIHGGRVMPCPKPLSVRVPREGNRQRPVGVSALGGWQQHRPIPVGLVVLSLLPHTVLARIAPREVLAALESVVRSAPVVRVKRGNAREAARRILAWMERTT